MEQLLTSEQREVLIAVDGSDCSELAFNWALRNYCKPQDHVRLIHVRKSFADMEGKLPADAIETLEQQSEAAARVIVEKYMKKCAVADLDCDWKIAVGDEREVICREVMRVCADVLIVGTRGLSPVKKALLGSVSEYCAHHSACPVIIVKAKEPKPNA
ncbi:hypothetical protein CLOM_g3123 [Closterium sp. NIES-68]|nr:hypothetical protein CLOM_g3123 [Closterium sp. NIES-68]GJP43689.1 hypothetical protein CLOM_g3123 [Closterium sp. NIES-68]GJP74252.1 hypothetical protein CLOP_g4867 [Closterium sp. NIES-67]GJP79967.1 hypothetical protein CLOP_g10196 [Closterium sp. NIES-67]